MFFRGANTPDKALNTRHVSCSPLTPFPIKLGVPRHSHGAATPRRSSQKWNQDVEAAVPAQLRSRLARKPSPQIHLLFAPHIEPPGSQEPWGSSWSSLDCNPAVSRPGEDLRRRKGQQVRDCETLGGGCLGHCTAETGESTGGAVGALPIPPVALSTAPSHPGPPLHHPCSLPGCPFAHLQDTARSQIQLPACCFSGISSIWPSPGWKWSTDLPLLLQCEGWQMKPLLPTRDQNQQGVAVNSSSLSLSLKPPHQHHLFQKGRAKESNTNHSSQGNQSKLG